MANNSKPTNPFAYPIHTEFQHPYSEGMTLLDHFAGQAMQSYIINNDGTSDERIVEYSYRIATRMLEERQKHL